MTAGSSLPVLPTLAAEPRPMPRALRRMLRVSALVAGDAAAALAAVSVEPWISGHGPILEDPQRLAVALSPVAIFGALGLYAEWGLGPIERLRLRGIGVMLAALGAFVIAYTNSRLSPTVLAATVIVAGLTFLFGYYIEHEVRRLLRSRRHWGVPTALIGEGPASQALARMLSARPEFGLRPVGFIRTTEPEIAGAPVLGMPLPVLGHLGEAAHLARDIEVAIAIDRQGDTSAQLLRLPFRHVVVSHGIEGEAAACPRICSLGGALGVDLRRDIYRRSNLALKRAFDLALALPLLIAATPLILALAALIKLLSPGPAFFRHARVGHNGRVFEVLKLRSMHLDADRRLAEHLARDPAAREEWAQFYKLRDDPRIIPGVGSFIRSKSLDELPQLLNVVLGEMSLVGPRPFPDYHLAVYDEEFRSLRASVPPGLTGFWQISARSDGDIAVQRTEDSYYITNWSIWLDLYILFRTPVVVFGGKGAR